MRKSVLCLLSIAALFMVSCSKENVPEAVQENDRAIVRLSIQGENSLQTKASGSGHGIQSDDNIVNTLEIFIFRNTGEQAVDNGQLELYKKYSAADLSRGLSGLELISSTGKKTIYAVCNSHKDDNFAGVNSLATFKNELSLLKNENVKNFTMCGYKDVELNAVNDITIPVKRLVARVKLTSVSTAFAGTPYEGSTLQNVKAYLINVHAEKLLYNGSNKSGSQVLNLSRYIENDCTGFSMVGMLYESIADKVDDTGNNTTRWFYTFENTIEMEDPTVNDYYTRLIIEGTLNGVTYYYPVNINREGFGYVSSEDTRPGIERNKSYELSVVISKPGSLNPNMPIVNGTVSVSVNVENWTIVPSAVVNF